MSLRHSYTLFAPLYDRVMERVSEPLRQRSLQRLSALEHSEGLDILLPGIGSGLDIAHLPRGHRYVGLDLTPAMLRRAEQRSAALPGLTLQCGDIMALPFDSESFDVVILHLILAVVPDPRQALIEVERVLRPGGTLLILDKFLRPDERAPLRRLFSPMLGAIATRTDVVFEELLAHCPSLELVEDEAAMAGGWFRQLGLLKRGNIGPQKVK